MKVTMILEGSPALLGNIQRLQTVLYKQANQSAWNQAQHLFSRTRAVVPYMDGDLYGAAYIANISPNEKNRVWAVGYDTVKVSYAMTVHETPNRVHPTRGPSREPKQDHYLSEPRDAMAKTYPKTVADEMAAALHGIRFV
jgi:hypothetical protein